MDAIESAFLSDAQKLNKKRQAQLIKRVQKILSELSEAHEKGDKEEVEGILASLQMPSQKEWRKLVKKLIVSSVEAGVLRSHFELMRLKELYEFAEDDTWEVVNEGYDYDVIFPEEAKEFLDKYSYEIGVITEETVLNRIREALGRGLEEGISNKELIQAVRESADTWLGEFHAETIARTENGKMYNAGRLARYLAPENNGFVEALQYDAIVDTRTTDLCRHLDGRIIAITNGAMIAKFTPPNHFRCRATWIAVTKYEDWEDNWDDSQDPEKGFLFEPKLPALLNKATQPLVQPKKEVTKDPSKITDPDIIRNLTDEDFKVAIGNITDPALKLAMILERAEKMAVTVNGLVEETAEVTFKQVSYHAEDMELFFIFNGREFFAQLNKRAIDIYKVFLKEVNDPANTKRQGEIIEAFCKKYADNPDFMDLIAKFRKGLSLTPKTATWKGLDKVTDRSEGAKKLFKIKTPPKTANYKNATGLQQAVTDGQAWIEKFMDNKLAPSTGVALKFQHDLRRAYAIGAKGTIHFGKWESDAGVVVHETAHVMHWQNKLVADLVYTFFMKRTADLKLPWSKRHGEDVIADHFYNSYIGRIYGWEDGFGKHRMSIDAKGFYGQEVLSMGMQAMYTDPMKFYKEDKEHFLFTYAILKGLF